MARRWCGPPSPSPCSDVDILTLIAADLWLIVNIDLTRREPHPFSFWCGADLMRRDPPEPSGNHVGRARLGFVRGAIAYGDGWVTVHLPIATSVRKWC